METNSFQVQLPNFSGPLDLLLHLVQKEQMSIWDVSLAKITEEYLSYLETMQELNLDVTCEFLVLAATLLQIKARSLLPKPTVGDEPGEEETREELIKRLLEYKKFKIASEMLGEKYQQETGFYSKTYQDPHLALGEPAPKMPLESSASIWDLLDLMHSILSSRVEISVQRQNPQVPRKQVSLAQTILNLRNRFKPGYSCSFWELLREAKGKDEIIVTFLASLELIRLGAVGLRKENGQIILIAEG